MHFLKNKIMTIFALGLIAVLAMKTGDASAAEEVAKSFSGQEMQQYAEMASNTDGKEAAEVTGGFFITDAMLALSIAALAAVIYVAFA
jgi:hypothetical protein